MSRASRVRWWYQRERAWWRRRQVSQCPACAGRGWVGEQAPGFGDGERDHPGVGGRGLVRPDRGGAWVPVRRRSRAAVTAQMARAAMTSTVCRAIAV